MKIDRLMGIVVYLLNNGRTSAQKLAEEFEVSSRTIMRDIESIELAGIPIQTFYGVEGGYQIMDGFVLEKQIATTHDYDWIAAALKGKAVSVDLSAAKEDSKINEQLALLETAIKKKCAVRFSYTNRLVRMDNLRITDIKAAKAHNFSDIKIKDSNDNIVHIKLYGKAIIKTKCREYLNGRITQEFENGDFEFCFSVPEHETFWYGVILSFGNKAKIIEPQELKERIIKTCKEIQMEYGE